MPGPQSLPPGRFLRPNSGESYSYPLIELRRTSINAAYTRANDNVIDLATRERKGRRRLVEQLFEEHARALRLFLKGRLVPDQDIEELIQELFTRLMSVEALEKKTSESTGSNRAYLLTMANNMLVDLQRKSTLRRTYSSEQAGPEVEPVDERTPEQIVAAQMELEVMKSVIMEMRPTWRQAFVLHRFSNLRYEDIALEMGMTVKQVENAIAQAMKRIRKAKRRMDKAGSKLC